jgi:hypothetical protein
VCGLQLDRSDLEADNKGHLNIIMLFQSIENVRIFQGQKPNFSGILLNFCCFISSQISSSKTFYNYHHYGWTHSVFIYWRNFVQIKEN